MSGKNTEIKQSSRLDRFLFYAKFVVLIVVAILFVIAYSFTYKDFPVSTALYEIHYDPDDELQICSEVNLLIVMDSDSNYQGNAYTDFYLLKDLVNKLPEINYDVTIVNNNAPDFTVLNNMSDNLLLRIYQEKQYQYIVALGDDAVNPAKEIKELFYPKSKVLLYGVSSAASYNALFPLESVSSNIANTMTVAYSSNPNAKNMIFLYDDNNHSDIMMNKVQDKMQYFDGISFVMLNANQYSVDDAVNQINQSEKNDIVFYVSFMKDGEDKNLKHSEIINNFQSKIKTPVYDLSPILKGDEISNSIRYCPHEASDEPLAYLALMPKNVCITGFELIEYAASNLTRINDESCYSFVNWCMQDMGLSIIPDNLSELTSYCRENSEFITKDELRPGDLIFISSTNNSLESVDDVYVYVNNDIVIGVNENGVLCFTKPSEKNYQVAYYHPYTAGCSITEP